MSDAWVASTLPTTWTGRRPVGRRVATVGSFGAPSAEWAIRRMTQAIEIGMLDVGDGHELYWEVCGRPDGKPAVSGAPTLSSIGSLSFL